MLPKPQQLPALCLPHIGVLMVVTVLVLPGIVFSQSRVPDKARDERAGILPDSPSRGNSPFEPEEGPSEEAADSTPLGVDLLAIRLISHQDQTNPAASGGTEAIEIAEGVLAPAGLREEISPYLGKPISMALLAELAKSVIHAWRNEDFPIVDVYFPEQNITGGRVQIVVREALLGKVIINDTVQTDPAFLEKNIRLSPGDRIDQRILLADLDWINRNPVRQINLVYETGETDGTSDIALETVEEPSLTAYTGFANTGVSATGENEWSAGINWANPFQTEQSIGYHYGADLEFESLESHTLFYRNFLPWRHELRFLGAAVFSDVPGNPAAAVPIDLSGENLQASLDYLIPLPRPREFRALKHDLVAGLDWKSTNTDLIFGGLNALASTAEIFQVRLAWEASWRDRLGYQFLSLGSVWSPGGVLNHNDDASFDALRQGATSDYWYGFAEIERGVDLPSDFRLVLRGRGHLSDDRLLSTEQLLAGGYLTVRGFEENLVRGDSGGILNLELHTPTFPLAKHLGLECQDEWTAFVFYDGAFLENSDPLPGETSPALQSTGLGFNARLGENAHLRAAYGWVLDTHGVPVGDVSDGRMHFGVTLRY
ncbi:MAG: ShlB/FhaC/HecB family hemolysin secretion/activation protein [Verrucomicrobiae bacterium]|nr:ShlB/FhaC/HecB family hemolysin secretion/activation protein [Verrucomicrobiae bacterium]